MAVDSAFMKVIFGRRAVTRSLREQLARTKSWARERAGEIPTLLAEFGIPFDLQRGRAYQTGDFHAQEQALDRSFAAIEQNLLDCLVWNYCPDNSNARGDLWNGEDLSIFSRDQQADAKDINSGGRALRALVRPYPRATAGEVTRMSFDMKSRSFEMSFRHDARVSAPSEIYVPRLQYPNGVHVDVSDGTFALSLDRQVLEYRHGTQRAEHVVRLTPRGEGVPWRRGGQSRRSIIEDNRQQGTVDLQGTSAVVDETELPESVHEEADP
jgi:hypothetical protein